MAQARQGRFVPFRNERIQNRQESEPRSQTRPLPPDEKKTAAHTPAEENGRRPPDASARQAESRTGRSRRSGRFSDQDNIPDEGPARRSVDQQVRRRRAQMTEYGEDDFDPEEHAARKAERKKRKQREREFAAPTPIYLPEFISVSNLANKMKIRAEELVRKMEEVGFEDIQNDDVLTSENAGMVAMELNFEPIPESTEDLDIVAAPVPEDTSDWPQRPPVVTIMGHVDHGKTTILDYLRKSSVAATEFGGITQHIGAFSVPLSSGKMITFLDTPGHAAFLNMRQRGANVTDIVVLVVAADDSVMPQTIEAIKHAQGAGVPIIVAINKIDKEDANPERVKQDLSRNGVIVEDYGGDTQVVEVSGKTGRGMSNLEETVTTLSEILDHRATTEGPVEGWVLEVQTKKSGRAATVLVRRGTLRKGDFLVAGTSFARVRTIKNEAGVEVESVSPGIPAEIDGWRGIPEAGDEVLEAPTEQKAADVTEHRETKRDNLKLLRDTEAIAEYRHMVEARREKEEAAAAAAKAAEEAGEDPQAASAAVMAQGQDASTQSGPKIVPFIIKADVSGSAEAVENYIQGTGNSEVGLRILRTGVGVVSEFDIEHAAVAGGHVIAFNTTIAPDIRRMAEDRGVKLLDRNIIYRVVDDVKAILNELLPPLVTQRVTGEAVVLQVFNIALGRKKTLSIAGCRVTNGTVGRNSKARVFRGGEKLYDGVVSSLKQVKKDVMEMQKGSECGMGFEEWNDFEAGDTIQCYEERHEKRFL
ncbi:initiation factor 2 [Saccharata proteae CBS 121410]|uniref:Translation initiation factor IF-2, mitochondrial n=1 Tax=Saccharata proteae CBS 121410 TaxID=1314787 RepID=A0A9P4HSJ4_9PEZI|nr:initiation factor 2 [Saccharata proteae CBS 121410]